MSLPTYSAGRQDLVLGDLLLVVRTSIVREYVQVVCSGRLHTVGLRGAPSSTAGIGCRTVSARMDGRTRTRVDVGSSVWMGGMHHGPEVRVCRTAPQSVGRGGYGKDTGACTEGNTC